MAENQDKRKPPILDKGSEQEIAKSKQPELRRPKLELARSKSETKAKPKPEPKVKSDQAQQQVKAKPEAKTRSQVKAKPSQSRVDTSSETSEFKNPELLRRSIKKAETEPIVNYKALMDPRVIRLILICIVGSLLLLFLTLPSFRIQKLTSTPLRLVSEQDLVSISGITKGQHLISGLLSPDLAKLFRGRYVKAERRVKANIPQIRDIQIKLLFPSTISFIVDERLPIAAIKLPDGVALIDRDGLVLEIKARVPDSVPVISGLDVRKAESGAKLEVDLERELNRALSMLSALVEADADSTDQLQLMPLLEDVRPGAYQRVMIRLRLPNNGKILNLSCAQNDYLTKHFVWLRRVIASGVFDDRVPGTLDLSGRYQIFKPLDKNKAEMEFHWGEEDAEANPADQETEEVDQAWLGEEANWSSDEQAWSGDEQDEAGGESDPEQ